MTLREQFENETGESEAKIHNPVDRLFYDNHYVEWLETSLNEAEDRAENGRVEFENTLALLKTESAKLKALEVELNSANDAIDQNLSCCEISNGGCSVALDNFCDNCKSFQHRRKYPKKEG